MANQSTIKNGYEASMTYVDGLALSFGIHSSIDEIMQNRFVCLTDEGPATNGEIRTDNPSVNYVGGTGVVGGIVGIIKYGYEADTITYLPGINRDRNCTVVLSDVYYVEVAAGEEIAVGSLVNSTTEGLAAANDTAGSYSTGCIALSATTGIGTVAKPEYVKVLIAPSTVATVV